MSPYFSIIVFALLAVSSVVTGAGNYMDAKGRIAADLDNALANVIAERQNEWVTADTIRVCKQLHAASNTAVALVLRDECFARKLSIAELRDKCYVSLAVLSDGKKAADAWRGLAGVGGDTVIVNPANGLPAGVLVALRGNADCSFATVFSLSDQRLPAILMLVAMLWGVFSLFSLRRNAVVPVAESGVCTIGNMRYDKSENAFYNAEDREIRFTPMQHALMEMFFNAEGHKLCKAEICAALWPKKDDASETLYTLIRRLKQVVRQDTNVRIEGERGRSYRLTVDVGEMSDSCQAKD